MNAFRFDKRLGAAILALWLASMACSVLRTASVGELKTETQTVELGSAQTAHIQIEMDAGELAVQSGSNNLMEATFRYNVEEWRPDVEYHVSGDRGQLTVSGTSENVPVGDKVTNQWDIRLSDTAPIDLEIHTAAGESQLDLVGINLTGLQIETGAGVTEIDLSGNWQQDVNVAVKGGVGEITVRLPSETGVRINMDTALVSVTTRGLEKDGDGYVNQAYGVSAHTLTLSLEAGVGSVVLEVAQP